LSAWQHSRADEVIVVVHPEDDALARAVQTGGGTAVRPDEPPPEMKASVLAGLAFVRETFAPAKRDAWLLAPADMPLLETAAIDHVIMAHDPALPRIVIPTYAGLHGHPVLFPWPLAVEVERLPDGEGVNELARRHIPRELPCDRASILADVDTPDDYGEQHPRAKRPT
jgi:molybdenum cofactor cytidylyltransferase